MRGKSNFRDVPSREAMEAGKREEVRPSIRDVDEAGVDRAQIRRMLRMSPADRLRWLEEFMTSVAEIRRLNAKRPLR
jgi:hypothetical protein